MIRPDFVDRFFQLSQVVLRLLDSGSPVPFFLPPLDVLLHLVLPTSLLLDLIAQLALLRLVIGVVYQFKPTSFSCPVLFITLLAEISPLKISTRPSCHIEVAHVVVVVMVVSARWWSWQG